MEVRADAEEDHLWVSSIRGSFLAGGRMAASAGRGLLRDVCVHTAHAHVLDRCEVQIRGPLHGGFLTCLHPPSLKAVFSIHREQAARSILSDPVESPGIWNFVNASGDGPRSASSAPSTTSAQPEFGKYVHGNRLERNKS